MELLFNEEANIGTSVICRICHDGESKEDLVNPCECSGSMAFIHISCLEKWLGISGTDQCEICHYKFMVEMKNQRFTCESFYRWLQWMFYGNRQILFGDLLCFLVLTPLCFIAMYLCAFGISTFHMNRFWENVGLITLSSAMFVTYCAWIIVSCRYLFLSWKIWSKKKRVIKVLLHPRVKHISMRNCDPDTSSFYSDEHDDISLHI